MGDADASSPLYVLWLGDGAAKLPRARVEPAAHDLSAEEIAALAPDLIVLAGAAASRAGALAKELVKARSDVGFPLVTLEAGARLDPGVLETARAHEGRAGLLIGDTAVVMDAEGHAAPDRGALHGGALRFVARPPGRVRILRPGMARDPDSGGTLEGARMVAVGVDVLSALEARGAQVSILTEAEPNAVRANDPTVIVLETSALSSGAAFALALADDTRLASASLLIVNGDISKDNVLAAAARLAQREVDLAAQAAKGDLVIDRVEALGIARWLKVAARAEATVLSARVRTGIGEVHLASGKIREATFKPAEGGEVLTGRAAIQEILAQTAGTVLLGTKEDVARGRPSPRGASAKPSEAKASEPKQAKVPGPKRESTPAAKPKEARASAPPKVEPRSSKAPETKRSSAPPKAAESEPRSSRPPDAKRATTAVIGDPLWSAGRKKKAEPKHETPKHETRDTKPKSEPAKEPAAKAPAAKEEVRSVKQTLMGASASQLTPIAAPASVPKPGAETKPAQPAAAKSTLIGTAASALTPVPSPASVPKPGASVPKPEPRAEATPAPSVPKPEPRAEAPAPSVPKPEPRIEPMAIPPIESKPAFTPPAKPEPRVEPKVEPQVDPRAIEPKPIEAVAKKAEEQRPSWELESSTEASARRPSSSIFTWVALAAVAIGLVYVAVQYGGFFGEEPTEPPEASGPPFDPDEPIEPVADPEPVADVDPEPVADVDPEPIADPEPVADVEPESVVDPEPVVAPEPVEPASGNLVADLEAARQSRNWPRIQRAAERVLAQQDGNAMAAYWLALAHSKQYHYDEAIRWVTRAQELMPDDGDPALLEGDIHRRFGRRTRAIATWRQCVEQHPRFQPCVDRLGLHDAAPSPPSPPPPSEGDPPMKGSEP